jgi:hypothetical protein
MSSTTSPVTVLLIYQHSKRVLGLVAQKFVSDVATDAHEYYKMRQQTLSAKEKKQQQGKVTFSSL